MINGTHQCINETMRLLFKKLTIDRPLSHLIYLLISSLFLKCILRLSTIEPPPFTSVGAPKVRLAIKLLGYSKSTPPEFFVDLTDTDRSAIFGDNDVTNKVLKADGGFM